MEGQKWIVSYARHHGSYTSDFDTLKDAIGFAKYLHEYGEGFFKEIIGPSGGRFLDYDQLLEYICEEDGERP